MGYQLPLELIDAILEHLDQKYDKSVLRSCCLVCKTWIHPSRRRLFADMGISNRNGREMLKLSSSTTWPISPYVRRLRFLGPLYAWFWSQASPHFRSFENLHSLVITRQPLHHSLLGPGFTGFNTVTHLQLVGVFIGFTHFTQFIHVLPHLHTLVMTDCHSMWVNPDLPGPTFPPPHGLRVLDVRNSDWVVVLQWLRSFDRMPALHTLRICGSSRTPGDTTLSTFLQELGPDLEVLRLGPDVIEESVFVNHNPRLRSLAIQFWSLYQNSRYLVQLLSQIVSCEMEEITIRLFLARNDFDAVDWHRVDEILARPQFSKLRTLRICTYTDKSAWFVDRLPLSHARNILSLQSIQTELSQVIRRFCV